VQHIGAGNKRYLVRFRCRFSGVQAGGLRTNWSVPSGTTGNRECMGPSQTNAANANDGIVLDMRWAVHGYGTDVAYTDPRNSTGLHTFLEEQSMVSMGSTAGPITLQWAQNVSNATGTVIQGDSWVSWQQVT